VAEAVAGAQVVEPVVYTPRKPCTPAGAEIAVRAASAVAMVVMQPDSCLHTHVLAVVHAVSVVISSQASPAVDWDTAVIALMKSICQISVPAAFSSQSVSQRHLVLAVQVASVINVPQITIL